MTTMCTKKPKMKKASLDGKAHNPTNNNRRIAYSFPGSDTIHNLPVHAPVLKEHLGR